MGFSTNDFHCNVVSGEKDNGNCNFFNITEPPSYLINIIPKNVLYQNLTYLCNVIY